MIEVEFDFINNESIESDDLLIAHNNCLNINTTKWFDIDPELVDFHNNFKITKLDNEFLTDSISDREVTPVLDQDIIFSSLKDNIVQTCDHQIGNFRNKISQELYLFASSRANVIVSLSQYSALSVNLSKDELINTKIDSYLTFVSVTPERITESSQNFGLLSIVFLGAISVSMDKLVKYSEIVKSILTLYYKFDKK